MARIRLMTTGDIGPVADLTARAFGQDNVQEMREELSRAYRHCPFMREDLGFVAEEEGRILAKWQILDFRARLSGAEIRLGGVQAVVAEPDQRGRGPAIQIVAHGIRWCREEGFDLVLGFAQRARFYERLGANLVMAEPEIHVDTRRIPQLREDPFKPMTPQDLPLVLDHYHASNLNRSGSMLRTVEHWDWMPRRAPEVLLCDEGYVGFRRVRDAIEIRELGGRTPAFYESALRKLGEIAREGDLSEVRGPIPLDHPFSSACARRGAEFQLRHPRDGGALALLINLESLLQKLQPSLSSRIAESTRHDLRITLHIHCQEQECELILNPRGPNDARVEIDCGPAALLPMIFGYKSARSTAFEHALDLDELSLQLLEILFPQGHPFMWEPDRY
ncbi:GNAT family N-acetyltransferase [Myxococcota bacterium]|nr:GNAT family N-acetyltransferase [Myxococcota bacterium]